MRFLCATRSVNNETCVDRVNKARIGQAVISPKTLAVFLSLQEGYPGSKINQLKRLRAVSLSLDIYSCTICFRLYADLSPVNKLVYHR